MQINGLQQFGSIQSVGAAPRVRPESAPSIGPTSTQSTDQLDLSAEAQALGETAPEIIQFGGVRWEKVDAIRQSIAAGKYESPEKMSAALDKLLDAFA